MSEILYEFSEGPYSVLDFTVEERDGKAVIEINDGGLGRLPVEDLETVEELRNALDRIEEMLEEKNRHREEF
ncbi:MAG: hypothetical protein ABEJ95_00720 [Candidatus Nanohalobium sp.]